MTANPRTGQFLPQVKSGEIISSAWVNDLIDTVNDLASRVASLEDSQAQSVVVITDLIYTSPLRLGAPLEIRGRNFGWSRGVQEVRFDNTPVTNFLDGSSDTRLLVSVPAFSNFPESGREVQLEVSDGVHFARRTLFVLPADIPVSGNLVDVLWETITPNPMVAGQRLSIGFRLRSRVASTRSFNIGVSVTPSVLQTGYEILAEDDRVVSSRRIELAGLQSKLFFVKLAAIPATLPPEGVSVVTTAVSGGVTGSQARSFKFNDTASQDPAITLGVNNFSAVDDAGVPLPASDGLYDAVTKTVSLRGGVYGRMNLNVYFTEVAIYLVSLTPSGSVDGWTRQLETSARYEIESNDLIGGTAKKEISIGLSPTTSAGSGKVELRVQRDGATVFDNLEFDLARLP